MVNQRAGPSAADDVPSCSNGNSPSVPFKIEVDVIEDYDQRRMCDLMHDYGDTFEDEARHLGMDVEREEIQLVSDGRRLILPIQVKCSRWRSHLIPLIDNFFVAVGRIRNGYHQLKSSEMPSISTHSLLLYPLRLITNHVDVPLTRIQFGSLMNKGQFGAHWILTRGKNEWMNCCFEYDSRKIAVYYSNQEESDTKYRVQEGVRGRIMVDMSSIGRILLNQKTGREGYRRISLIILLETPPKLHVRKNAKNTAEARTTWTYRDDLRKGFFPGETSDKLTLHDSKALVLELDHREGETKAGSEIWPIDKLLYDALSKLRHKTSKAIEYVSVEEHDLVCGEVKHSDRDRPYPISPFDFPATSMASYDGFDRTALNLIDNASHRIVQKERIMDRSIRESLTELKTFRLRALLQGILDRGMEYRIELLRNRRTWYSFVGMCAEQYVNDEQRALFALERVMCVVSDGRPSCSIAQLFQKEWADCTPTSRSALFNEQEKKEGYWRIMKLIATPTRLFFVGYEMIMGNRVMKKFAKNENHIIRLTFRDDRGGPMRTQDYVPEVQNRIKSILVDGIDYAGRTFAWLGNSNSQLREQGCYLIHVDRADRSSLSPHFIRRQMGNFDEMSNIPKLIARLGQVFTQSKPSEITIFRSDVGFTPDFTGGMNAAGKPYVYSDGVGQISVALAASLSKELGLSMIASAFQIRFRGEKGMLCVDPSIDEKNELLELMGRNEDQKKVLVRPSMSKFNVEDEQRSNLEIVKVSASSPVFLNRPFINILCQVSLSQSAECHKRMRERVEELMHQMLRESFQSLYIERKAAEAIKEMSFSLPLDAFNASNGFSLTTDPFFSSLLHANVKYVLNKQLCKMNIHIPTSSGRTMFGVVDETGILQYGQVFCQYSGSMSKHGGKGKSMGKLQGLILKGRVLITKNPCHSSGDVRMFDAIDIPALRHLVDVIVFPMHGPRPHPDEMAGSDLDGDEYLVIWDEGLFLERSEEASFFPIGEEKVKWKIPRKINGEVDVLRCEEGKANFFTEAIVHGQPGMLCTAHLAISDLYGLNSKPAIAIADKISQTLDYQKSGIKPAELTKMTVEDPDDPNRVIPAEKSFLKPDYIRNFRDPAYLSSGILGEIFRAAEKYEYSLDCANQRMTKIDRDPSFAVDGSERYRTQIKRELDIYEHAMRSVMEHYGIATEEEMLSGMIVSMKNRLSDNEEVDRSHFTTNRAIDSKLKRIIETAKEKFFETLLNWKTDLEESENRRDDVREESILNRRVKSYTPNIDAIRRKAAAAYNVAYEEAQKSVEKGEQCVILLSFPWILFDVLADIKHRPDSRIVRVPAEEHKGLLSDEPLADRLSVLIDRYSEEPTNAGKFAKFMRKFKGDESIVARSMKENKGLSKTAFVLSEWAHNIGGLNDEFREEHLLSLFVLFGLGEIGSRGRRRRFIQKPRGDIREHSTKGVHLLYFIDYVSSHEFRTRSSLSFEDIGSGILMRGEWKSFSEIALASFLSLATTHHLDLPIEGRSGVAAAAGAALREYEPRVMQLPAEVVDNRLDEVEEALRKVSGAQVHLRKTRYCNAMVSAIGTAQQLRILSSLIYPPAPPRDTATVKGTIEKLVVSTFERIIQAAKDISAAQI